MIRSFLLAWLKPLSLDHTSPICVWGAKFVSLLVLGMGFSHVLIAVLLLVDIQASSFFYTTPLFVSIDYPVSGIISGLALLVLALGLFRRKSAAWRLGLILFIFIALSRVLFQAAYFQTFVALFFAIWLFLSRPSFFVRSRKPTSEQGLCILIFALILAALYGFWGYIDSETLIRKLDIISHRNSMLEKLILFFRMNAPQDVLHPRINLVEVFFIFGAVIGAYILIKMIQPAKPVETWDPVSLRRARKIVERYGCSSYAYLTLLKDKIHFFSKSGSLIAYRVKGRVAIVLGDPIGPEADIFNAIDEFRSFCALNDWLPAFCFTLPDYLDHYRQVGFNRLCMGHEGIIKLDGFGLSGGSRANFRKRFRRMLKLGFRVEFLGPPIPEEIISQLHGISDEWLGMTNRKEKRFFLGCFDPQYIQDGLVAVVYTPYGEISAFVNLVPEYQRNEISIDLMRRREACYSGTMDFLFVSLFLWAQDQGYDTFNLGLCALSGVGERPTDPLAERILHWVYQYGSKIYDFNGLYQFKKKFLPYWVPQYVVFPKFYHLPSVWFAMARVNFSR